MSVGGEAGVHLSALSEADMRRCGTHNLRCGRLARMAKDSLKKPPVAAARRSRRYRCQGSVAQICF